MIQPLKTALKGSPSGMIRSPAPGRAQALAREIQGRYERLPLTSPAVELALRQGRAFYNWTSNWHVHLAPRLELAVLAGGRQQPGKPGVRRVDFRPGVPPIQPGLQPPPAQAVLRLARRAAAAEPLVARLQARSLRTAASGAMTPEQALAHPSPAAPPGPAALPARPTQPGPAARVFLRQAGLAAAPAVAAAPPAPASAFPALPAHPRAGGRAPTPVLHLEQLPPHELNRLAERVAQTIDRRILAQRERLGRL